MNELSEREAHLTTGFASQQVALLYPPYYTNYLNLMGGMGKLALPMKVTRNPENT